MARVAMVTGGTRGIGLAIVERLKRDGFKVAAGYAGNEAAAKACAAEHDVMIVKVKGEFVWHKHDETDDFFLVLKGRLDIELRDEVVSLGPGELFIVPKGVEHRPVAQEEVELMLIERRGTPNTGDAKTAAERRVI